MLRWQQVSVTAADSIIAQAVSSSHTYLPSNPGKHWVFQYTSQVQQQVTVMKMKTAALELVFVT